TVRPEQAEDSAEGQLKTHGVNSVEGLAVLRISLRESIGFYSDLVQASPFPGARGAPPLMPVLAGGPTACHRGAYLSTCQVRSLQRFHLPPRVLACRANPRVGHFLQPSTHPDRTARRLDLSVLLDASWR